MKLFSYQAELDTLLRESIKRGNRSPLVVLSTGGGKTVLFSHICFGAVHKNKRVLILTHRQELLRQAGNTLRAFGLSYGIIKAGCKPNYAEKLQVASVATLVKRLNAPIKPDVIIIDEAHHATAATYKKIFEAFGNPIKIGFTATPIRTDGAGLGDVFDDLVQGVSMRELIKLGRLVKPVIFTPPMKIDLEGVRKIGGDYSQGSLAEAVDKPTITGNAVDLYRKHAHKIPVVAFCVSVAHAEHVAECFRASGYNAAAVSGNTPEDLRASILRGLGDGTMDVVCSCDLISEGFDIPAIGGAILLRPTQSLSLYLQQIGRALRVVDGKIKAIILDCAGNYNRFGHPAQDFAWTLEGDGFKKKKPKAGDEITVKRCASCYAVFEPNEMVNGNCPECGAGLPAKPRTIRNVNGELIEVAWDFEAVPKTAEELEREKAEQQRKKWAQKTEQARARTLQDLIELGKKRGMQYPHAWAQKIIQSRQNKRKW